MSTPSRALLRTAAVAAVLAAPVACTRTPDTPRAGDPQAPPPATAPDGAPVFPVPADAERAIRDANLTPMPRETLENHIHAHVDVIIDSRPVIVPADIGIVKRDGAVTGISPLHTHDATGVVHIESERPETFRVEQLFAEWGVLLDKRCIAAFCADDKNQLLAFANGELAPDPKAITFSNGLEVVIWYGPRGTNPVVPTSYDFSGVTEG